MMHGEVQFNIKQRSYRILTDYDHVLCLQITCRPEIISLILPTSSLYCMVSVDCSSLINAGWSISILSVYKEYYSTDETAAI
jgi:hypothetical protein